MNLLQNLGASAGSTGNPARESRLEVLEQEILNTPREQLPDVIAAVMNEFYGNNWNIPEFVHYLLGHAVVDVHLALIEFGQRMITEQNFGPAFAAQFREFLTDGVTTFVFRTTNPIVHAELYKLCGLAVPFYRAEAAMSRGQSMSQAWRLSNPGSNAQVQSTVSRGQSMSQAGRLSDPGFNAPVQTVQSTMSRGQSVSQAWLLSNPGSRTPASVTPGKTLPASRQLSVGNGGGMALEVRGGGGGQMVRHETPVDLAAFKKTVMQEMIAQLTPQLREIGDMTRSNAARVEHLEHGNAINASRMDQLEHSYAMSAESAEACRLENKANHDELKQLIIASLGNRGPAAPVPPYPTPPAPSAFVMKTAASSPGYACFMGMNQGAASSAGGGFMAQNKGTASSVGRGGFMAQNKAVPVQAAASSAGRGGFMGQNKAVPVQAAASSAARGGFMGGNKAVPVQAAASSAARGGFMGGVATLKDVFSQLCDSTGEFLSQTKVELVLQTIAHYGFQVDSAEYASVIALGARHSRSQGSKEASEKLTAAIRAKFPMFAVDWLPENFEKFSSTLVAAPDVGVKRPFAEMSPPNAEDSYPRMAKIPTDAFLNPAADASADGAGGPGELVDGAGGLGASDPDAEQGADAGGPTDEAFASLQQKLAEAEAAGEEEFNAAGTV
jgi:hypothetical protein